MVLKREITARIKEVLEHHPEGLSITDLVKSVDINRNTAGRYLENLLLSGQVEMRPFGMAKRYTLAKRLPASSVLSLSSELVIQLDFSQRIFYANETLISFLGSQAKDLLGKNIEFTRFPLVFENVFPELLDRFRKGLRGEEWHGELSHPVQKKYFFCRVAPTVFSEGTRGVSIFLEDITDQKRDEERIRKSEARLRSIFKASPVGIGVENNRILLEVNDRLCLISGYPAGELVGRSARMLYRSDEDFNQVGVRKNQQMRQSGTCSIETQWVKKDGAVIDVLLNETPLDPANISEGFTFTVLDITERKAAQERITELIRGFLAFSPDPVANINILTGLAGQMLKGTCALYNRLEGGMLCSIGMWNPPPGYNPCDRPEGHICTDIIHEGRESPTIIGDLQNSRYARTDPNVRQYQLVTYVGMPVRIGDRFLGSLCVVYQDRYISTPLDLDLLSFLARAVAIEDNRRVAAQALQESEDRYRKLVEISPGAVLLHHEGKILYANPAAVRLTGAGSAENLIGKAILDIVAPEYRGAVSSNISRDLDGVTTSPMELRLLRIDGTPVMAEGRGVSTSINGKPVVLVALNDITARSRAELALRESESTARALINAPTDTIILLDSSGTILDLNETAARSLGRKRGDLIGLRSESVIPEGITQERKKKISEVLVTKKPVRFIDERNGVWFDNVVYPILDSQENVSRLAVIARDITDQKAAEQALRKSEERYRSVFENTGAATIIVEENTIISLANAEFERLSGYSKREIEMKKSWTDFVVREDRETMLARHYRRRERNDVPRQYEFRFLRKNGDLRRALVTVDLIPGTRQTIASLTDVTDSRIADEQLLEREQQYRFIADNSLDIITRLSTDFICLYVSPAITPLLGYTEIEMLGKNLLSSIHPDDLTTVWDAMDASVRQGSLQLTVVSRLLHKDGRYRRFESTVRMIRDEKTGHVREYLCISRDISARKPVEDM